jgi:hypothetical protein
MGIGRVLAASRVGGNIPKNIGGVLKGNGSYHRILEVWRSQRGSAGGVHRSRMGVGVRTGTSMH